MQYPNLKKRDTLRGHIAESLSTKSLSQDEEYMLIEDWQKNMNKLALTRLIRSHHKLLQKIAKGYSKYGIQMDELMAEGYLGMIQAANSFNVEHGFRFSTYLTRSVKNFLQRCVMKFNSIVSVKPDNDNRTLYFQIKRVKSEIAAAENSLNHDEVSDKELSQIEQTLHISKEKIKTISKMIYGTDLSLNQSIAGDENMHEYQDMIPDPVNVEKEILEKDDFKKKFKFLKDALQTLKPKELKIFSSRRLTDEPKKLAELANELGITPERVRQIEHDAFLKLSKHIKLAFYKSNNGNLVLILFC